MYPREHVFPRTRYSTHTPTPEEWRELCLTNHELAQFSHWGVLQDRLIYPATQWQQIHRSIQELHAGDLLQRPSSVLFCEQTQSFLNLWQFHAGIHDILWNSLLRIYAYQFIGQSYRLLLTRYYCEPLCARISQPLDPFAWLQTPEDGIMCELHLPIEQLDLNWRDDNLRLSQPYENTRNHVRAHPGKASFYSAKHCASHTPQWDHCLQIFFVPADSRSDLTPRQRPIYASQPTSPRHHPIQGRDFPVMLSPDQELGYLKEEILTCRHPVS